MTWEQKIVALRALGRYPWDMTIAMRKPGDWFASVGGMALREGPFGHGCLGNGVHPEDAVYDLWRQCVDELPDGWSVRLDMPNGQYRYVRWNGFMWQDVPREETP